MTGWASTSTGDVHAFLYSDGQMTDLGTLGGKYSAGLGINNTGQITGTADTASGAYRAFLYSNGQMTDLGPGEGYRINDAGQVVGAGPNGAFLYSEGQMQNLGILGEGINNAGQVVGSANTADGVPHAFLYSNGQMQDLNGLIDPALRLTLYGATAINDQGQIVANRLFFSGARAYLLTPIPEPSTLALFGVALLGLGAWVRAHKSHS